MWTRLGNVLVEAKVITPAQLEKALRFQEEHGGRLGSILVDLKLIDVDVLGTWLSRISGFPSVTSEKLQVAKGDVLNIIPGPLAERLECIPFAQDPGSLHVACVNPYSTAVIETLSRRTKLALLMYVIPERMLTMFLRTHYGILGTRASSRGGERTAETPVSAPATRPERTAPPGPPPSPAPRTPTATSPHSAAASRIIALLDDASAAPTRTPSSPPLPAGEVSAIGQATAQLAGAKTRDEVVGILLEYAARDHDSALLLVVKDDMAVGWRAHGKGIDPSLVDYVILPLALPSLFQEAYETHLTAGGTVADTPVHGLLYKLLRRAQPQSAVVVPLVLRHTVVNLLYVDRLQRLDALSSGEALSEVARKAALALDRVETTKPRPKSFR